MRQAEVTRAVIRLRRGGCRRRASEEGWATINTHFIRSFADNYCFEAIFLLGCVLFFPPHGTDNAIPPPSLRPTRVPAHEGADDGAGDDGAAKELGIPYAGVYECAEDDLAHGHRA